MRDDTKIAVKRSDLRPKPPILLWEMETRIRDRRYFVQMLRSRPGFWPGDGVGFSTWCGEFGFGVVQVLATPTQPERERLETLVHEMLHAAYPDLCEQAIDEAGREMAAVLWHMGWRQVGPQTGGR